MDDLTRRKATLFDDLDGPADDLTRRKATLFDDLDAPPPQKPSFGENVMDLGTAAVEGVGGTWRSLKAAGQALIGDNAGAEQTARDAEAAQRASDAESLRAFKEDIGRRARAGDDTLWQGVKNVAGAAWENPAGAAQMTAEQLPNMAAAMAPAWAGFKAGAALAPFAGPLAPLAPIAGGVLGYFLGNAALETGGKVIEKAAGGLTDQERVDALKEGAVKGAVITGVDAATFGATKLLYGTIGKAMEAAGVDVLVRAGIDVADKAAVARAVATPAIRTEIETAQAAAAKAAGGGAAGAAGRATGAAGLQVAGESGGEGLGEYAATGAWSPTEAVLEGLSSAGQSVAEIAFAREKPDARGLIGAELPDAIGDLERRVDAYVGSAPLAEETAAQVMGAAPARDLGPLTNPADGTVVAPEDPGYQALAEQLAPPVAPADTVDAAIEAAHAATSSVADIARRQGAALAPLMDRQAALTAEAESAGFARDQEMAREQAATEMEGVRSPAEGRAADYVDLAPMDLRTANGRLTALRGMERAEGRDPAALVIAPHPGTPGRLAIARRAEPAPALESAPAPVSGPEAQARIEAAALTGEEANRRAEDAPRQVVISAAMRAIEERGGVASPAEARIVAEAGLGRPYDRIDESLAPPLSMDEKLTQATGIALDKAPRESAVQTKTEPTDAALTAREQQERSDSRMAELAKEATAGELMAQNQAPVETGAPVNVDGLLSVLKKDGTLHNAQEKLMVDAARKGLSPQQFDILQRAAVNPPSLSATDRLALRQMREGDITFSEQRPAWRKGFKSEPSRVSDTGKSTETAQQDSLRSEEAPAPESQGARLRYSHSESKLEEGAGPMNRNEYRLVRAIGRIFGKRVQVFTSGRKDAPDGYVIAGDAKTIYLNADSQVAPLVVFGHELMHQLKRDNPAGYEAVLKVIRLKEGANLDVAGIRGDMEEVTSDLLGNRFKDPDFWVDVFNQLDRPEALSLGQQLRKTVQSFIRAMRGVTGFDTDNLVANLEEVKAALTKALADYARGSRSVTAVAEKAAETAPRDRAVTVAEPNPEARRKLAAEAARRSMGLRFSAQREEKISEGTDQPAAAPGGQQPASVRAGRDAPRYGTAREGALAPVAAWHFSQQSRPVLSSASYGTGLKGSGRDQFLNAADPRSRQRIYFYVDKGNGIHPESGVGGAAHEVSLANVYDFDADPLKLKRGSNWQAFETALMDAGFDGYLWRDHNLSAAAVLLGPRTVPVAYRGTGAAATKPGGGVPVQDSAPVWQVQATGPVEMMQRKADALRAKPAWRDYIVRVVEDGSRSRVEVVKRGPVLNIGMSTREIKGGGDLTQESVKAALADLGVQVQELVEHQSDTEMTAVVSISRPLTAEEGDSLSVALSQEAIVQRMPDGSGDLYGPQAENWGPYNPDFFLMPDGSRASAGETVQASGKRISIKTDFKGDKEMLGIYLFDNSAKVDLPKGQKMTTEAVGAFLDKVGGPRRDWTLKKNQDRAVRVGTAEVRHMLRQERSGLDWYDEDVARAFRTTQDFIPSLIDERRRKLFTVLAGIMSPGVNARDNWVIAARAYQHFDATGTVPGRNPANGQLWQGGLPSVTKEKQLSMLNSLVKEMGVTDAVGWLFSTHPVREINAARATYGKMGAGVPGKASDERLGLFALGEKVGPFTMNLNGIHEVTVDRWKTRTFNRWMGSVLDETGAVEDAPTEPKREVVKDVTNRIAQQVGIKPYQVQSVLWFFEQGIYRNLGADAKSYGFSDGANRFADLERAARSGAPVRAGDVEATEDVVASEKRTAYDDIRDRLSDGRRLGDDGILGFLGSRDGQGYSRRGFVSDRDPAGRWNSIASAAVYWGGRVAGQEGYYTSGLMRPASQKNPLRTFLMPVIPSSDAGGGTRQDLLQAYKDGKYVLYLSAEETEPGRWFVAIDGAGPGTKHHQALLDSGELTEAGRGYHRLRMPEGTTEYDLLREGARRLSSYLGGETPTVEFVRATGATANSPDNRFRSYSPERVEARFSEKRDVTETPEFKRWFGDSKVVDGRGRPLVVYHGSHERWSRMMSPQERLDLFDRRTAGAPAALVARERPAVERAAGAIWFTDEPFVAEGYSEQVAGERAVLSGWLSMQKPLDLRPESTPLEEVERILSEAFGEPFETTGTYSPEREIAQQVAWENSRLVDYARKNGYDGLIYPDTDVAGRLLHTSYVALQPGQFKSTDNRGTFAATDPDITKSEKRWYSALERAFDGVATKAAPAAGWRDAIKGLVNKGLVKQDEVEWSGVNEWLGLQTGKVTKDQVTQFLHDNGVRVTETVLGRDGNPGADRFDWDDTATDNTKYGKYTLPGGTNYREVLLILPPRKVATSNRYEVIGQGPYVPLRDTQTGQDVMHGTYGRMRDEAAKRNAAEAGQSQPYRSSHWDVNNVLAHIRLNDRTDSSGRKVLFVEEIQSDWGQAGKKDGFKKNISPVTHEIIPMKTSSRSAGPDGYGIVRKDDEDQLTSDIYRTREEAESALRGGGAEGARVPRAPFVTKTDAWVALALKRVVKMAVDEGYDAVAFVNGDQSADRYDLSKQVDALQWNIKSGRLFAKKTDGSDFEPLADNVTDKNLEAYVGKEVAQRMIDAEPDGSYVELSGVDLKVGGEGMKAFYDKIVPSVAKEVLKKLGGAALREVSIPRDGVGDVWLDGRMVATGVSRDIYEAEWGDGYEFKLKRGPKGEPDTLVQPGFDVTPAMREKAAGGVPLFSEKRDVTETPEFKRWFGDSKVVDTDGKPLVVYHGTSADFSEFRVMKPGGDRFHFGTAPQANARIGMSQFVIRHYGTAQEHHTGANVLPVYLSIQNPVRLPDMDDWTSKGQWLKERGRMPAKVGDIVYRASQDSDAAGFLDAVIAGLEVAGYDGISYKNEHEGAVTGAKRGLSWIAFKPEQIKSAIGNRGTFDPTTPNITKSEKRIFDDSGRQYTEEQRKAFERVGFVVEVPTLRERLQSLRQHAGKKIAQGLFDQFVPIKDLSKRAYALARLSRGSSGAFEALLHHGKLKVDETGVYDADTTGGAIERVFMPLGGETGDFLKWIAANRAERLMGEGRERLFSDDDIAAVKSLEQGTTDFDYQLPDGRTTRDRTLIYRDSLKKFDEFNRNVLDVAEQSGLIDREARAIWEHEFYVPFYRVSGDGEFNGASVKNGLVRQQVIRALKGGTDKLNADLLSNTLLNWAHLVDASAKNRAAIATLEAAEEMGAAVEAPAGTAKDMAKAAGAHEVWVMDEGVKRHFVVADPHLMVALSSLQFAGLRGGAMDALSKTKHWLTVGVTASPFFKIRNLIRDSVSAIATSDLSGNVAGNLARGLKASERGTQEYVSALAGGGLIRFGTMLEGRESDRVRRLVEMGNDRSTILDSPSKVRALWNTVEKGISAYNELGNRGEEINRSALYHQLIEQGVPKDEAALQARDLLDFSMQGSWYAVRFLTQVVPFMNARLQGLYKLGRAAKENPAKFGAVVGAVLGASLVLMAAYSDDEDWKKREDWDRNNYWWFKFGGKAYRIPKPFEVGAIATLAERGAELFFNEDMTGERYYKIVKDLFLNSLSMNPVPQAFKPVVDLYSNKDSFTGRPIETMGMQKLDPEYRYTSRTTMPARAVSAMTGGALSPVQVDHLVKAYFGWLGALSVGAVDQAVRPLTSEPTRPQPDYWKMATGGLASETDSASSYYVTRLYEQAKEMEAAYATWRSLLKEGRVEEAKEYLEENKEDIVRHKALQKVTEGEAKFSEMIRMIERSTTMDAGQKKERINRIRAQQDRLARTVGP